MNERVERNDIRVMCVKAQHRDDARRKITHNRQQVTNCAPPAAGRVSKFLHPLFSGTSGKQFL